MPDDQPQIITPSSTSPETSGEPLAMDRPITVGYEPAAPAPIDPMPQQPASTAPPEGPKPSSISITVQDESGAPLPAAAPQPTSPVPNPVPAMPAPQPAVPTPNPAPVSPAPEAPLGITPPALDKQTLQDKINNHPLFSGAKDKPLPKQRKAKKGLIWSLVILLILLVGAYLAIDSGLVRGASHLPFHIFKQAAPVAQPVINTQQNTAKTSQTQTTATDPYAGWKTYSDSLLTFRYPSTWQLDSANSKDGSAQVIAPDDPSISLIDISTKKPSTTFSHVHLIAGVSYLSKDKLFAQAQNCMGEGEPANSCTVYDASTVNVPGATNPKLVISDFGNIGYPNYLAVSDDPAAQLNAKTYKTGASVASKIVFMSADAEYKQTPAATNFTSNGEFADITSLKSTQSYKDLLKIFESVTYK